MPAQCDCGRDNADKAERLLHNLARRLAQEAPAVAASILEGLDEILTVRLRRHPIPWHAFSVFGPVHHNRVEVPDVLFTLEKVVKAASPVAAARPKSESAAPSSEPG
jgi:hypothetical protein